MKAITIQQPWAHLIIHGYLDPHTGKLKRKDVENRTWVSSYKGPLLIHAGKSRESLDDFPLPKDTQLSFGAAIGIVEMFGCVKLSRVVDSTWASGPWCHQYRNPRALPAPIPFKGLLGYWDVPDDLLELIQSIGSIDLADFGKPLRRVSRVRA